LFHCNTVLKKRAPLLVPHTNAFNLKEEEYIMIDAERNQNTEFCLH